MIFHVNISQANPVAPVDTRIWSHAINEGAIVAEVNLYQPDINEIAKSFQFPLVLEAFGSRKRHIERFQLVSSKKGMLVKLLISPVNTWMTLDYITYCEHHAIRLLVHYVTR